MSWKQQISCQKLSSYTTYRPHISELIPFTAFKNNFRWSILSCAYDRWMRFVEESGSSKINNSNFIALWQVIRSSLTVNFLTQFFFLKQYVFRFEICVSIPYFVKKSNAFENLFQKCLNHLQRKSSILILFDKFIEW